MATRICESIESSPQDDREYKAIQLKENQLTVLLISDPTTDKAAAAMDVRVGHLSDPDEAPGLAHFCEHMLFMGTEKYPDENDYNVYLSSHGGSSNAYTDMESTNYHFDVSSDNLEGALDRFAQFFIAPLFQPDSTERELQAVDSEHAKNLQSDVWRNLQLAKSLCRDSHPFSKFGSGNLVTLKEEPAKRGLDLRQLLLKFHKDYYSANVMKLVILGKESLSELESLCVEYFSGIANYDIAAPVFPGEPFGPTQLSKQLSVVPVRDGVRSLDLQFPMREIDSLYLCKPTRYLSHLIGHEGAGSILAILKEKGWANELSSGESRSCSDWSAFSISIELTAEGLENVPQVVEIVFSYIHMIQSDNYGIQEWIHNESATVAACQFRFLSKRNPMDYALSLASTMQMYPPHHVLAGPYQFYKYDPELIAEFLKYFNPENMLMQVTSKMFEGTTSCKEQWYGTEYNIDELSTELRTQWSNGTVESDIGKGLALPERNDMIASDFTLLKNGAENMPKNEPRLLLDNDICRLWYKPDNVFDMPKVNIMVLLRTDTCSAPKQNVLALLYTQILQEVTNDFTYLASMASLHSNVSHSSRGLELTVSGYNHKAHILLKRLVKAMAELPSSLDANLWDRIKDKVSKQYENFLFAQPYQHGIYAVDVCCEQTMKWKIEDKQEALKNLDMEDLLTFAKHTLSEFYLEVLVHGNLSPNDAKEVATIIIDEFIPTLPSSLPQQLVTKFPQNTVHAFEEPNPNNTNSCLVLLYQMGPMDLRVNAILALLHHLLQEPAFNELRTQEQLGYIVHTSIKTNGNDVKSLLCLIQSDSYDPVYLESRVDAFMERLPEKLQSMSTEEFEKNIHAVCQTLREKDKNLFEETSKYWNVIMNQTYLFQRLENIADQVKNVSKEEVLEFFEKEIAKNQAKKLSVQVFSSQHLDKMVKSESNVSPQYFPIPVIPELETYKMM